MSWDNKNMNVKIIYGCDSISKQYETAPTVSQLKSDAAIKAVLGCGDNIKVVVNGIEMPDGARLEAGTAEVRFETVANRKAS